MKKIMPVLLAVFFILLSVSPSFGGTTVGVMLNNSSVSFNESTGYPFIDSNARTLVPLRQTMEAAGYTVSWDAINNIASVVDTKDTKVKVKIGDNYITKEINENGVLESARIKNDTFAQIVNDRTFLPIRVVLEAFGASVLWDDSGKNVIVNTVDISSNRITAEQIYSKYSPAVFYIEVYDASAKPLASGSGFFINSDGTAITNFHVIEGAHSAKITTIEGKNYNVEGVYSLDEGLDIAKIKVDGKGFPTVNIDNSGNVMGGSIAYTIGSPLGLSNTMSEGIIANPNRIINDMSYYQITAPISAGSSGGPLFDKEGHVIGIASGGYLEGQNLNIAIPITNIANLSDNTVTKLSTIASQAKKANVALLLSSSNVTLNVGNTTNVIISFENYDYMVEVEYVVADTSVVNASWGAWNANEIPLSISAVGKGSTSIQINLYDDTTKELLARKTIDVNVSQTDSIPYYTGLYPVPDFGALSGVPLYYDYYTSSGASFYYVFSIDETTYIIDYADMIIDSGFYYLDSFLDEDGYTVMVYENILYGLTLCSSITDLNGTICYTVMVLFD